MTTLNHSKSDGSAKDATPTSIEHMENEIQRLKALNQELVAALEFWRDLRNESKGLAYYHLNGEVAYWGEFDDPTDTALARAESAPPAKHPDTDTGDDYGCDEPLGATFARTELRAIDAAMKEARHD